MHFLPQIAAWLIAFAWLTRTVAALRGLPTIPNLLLPEHDLTPATLPSLTVIVPGRNEQQAIRACLSSLLAQDYPNLHILAVDDRSTDQTGALMDALAHTRLEVLHIHALPPLWLGKTHAMALAADHAIATHRPDFLLFTDADIFFRPDALRRALASAVATSADHLVLAPTTLIRRWDEAVMLAFFPLFGLWAARPWRVQDPRALRDAIGIGAFNLLRTSAYQRLGGFHAFRMEVVEDLAIALRVKQLGLRQRFVCGPGLVNVHWAAGVNGIVNVMTKNIFAAVRFHISLILLGCFWLLVFCVMPFISIWSRPFTLPATLILVCIAVSYRLLSRLSGLSAWNAVFAPFASTLFIYALLRSMLVTLYQGGIVWRGTFYPLADLRKHAAPLRHRP